MNLRKDHYRLELRRRRPDSDTTAAAAEAPPRGGSERPKGLSNPLVCGAARRGPRAPRRRSPARNWNRLMGACRVARPPHGCPVPAALLRRARGGLNVPGPARLGGAVTRGARGSVCRSVYFFVKPPVFVSGCCQKTKEYNS